MARKKANTEVKEEVIDVEAKPVEVTKEETQEDQMKYIMSVLNDARESNEESFIWNGIEIKVKRYLNIYEMKILFDSILSRCFSVDEGAYQPEYRDFAERASTVAIYSDLRMPDGVEDQFDLMYKTDLYYSISERIDPIQRGAVLDAIDEKIKETVDYRANQVIKNSEEVLSSVSDLVNNFNEMFDGVTPNELSGVIKAISENGIDEKAIVDAVINR